MPFPGSEALVAAAEARLGRRLPEPHRQRLIRANGGEVLAIRGVWTLYPVWDPTDRKTMGRTANHIVRENDALRADWPGRLPDGYLAIADDGGGDLLVLAPGEDEVRHWDHETGALSIVEVRWG
jgi:hypothetical protein